MSSRRTTNSMVASLLALLIGVAATAIPGAAAAAKPVPYGANRAAGATFVHDGVTLYYETYGAGPPLLIIHGNGQSIGSMSGQIDHFKTRYRVIAMDSRDQGKSGTSQGPITYEKMADDLAALLDHVKAEPADVVGWSDGGIEALLLGIRHPGKVRKLVAMASNLNPGPDALEPELVALVKSMFPAGQVAEPATPEQKRAAKVGGIMLTEPNIDPALLAGITAPTLILAADHDMVRLEHMIAIYRALPNANLAVFPDSSHAVSYDDPELFNATVYRFLQTPFRNRDRIADVMGSLEKMNAEMAK